MASSSARFILFLVASSCAEVGSVLWIIGGGSVG